MNITGIEIMYFKYAIILAVFLEFGANINLFGQSAWIKKIDLDRHDGSNGLLQGDQNTFYLLHRYEDGNLGPVTQNLTKMSLSGSEIWSVKFENHPHDVFEGPAAKLDNGDVIVCYVFEDTLTFFYNIYRLSPEGEILWTISMPRLVHQEIDYDFRLYKVIPVSSNDIRLFYRMGNYWMSDPPNAKNGYISIDSLGKEQLRTNFETNGEYQWPYNIITYPDSQFLKVYRPLVGQLDLVLRYDLFDKYFNEVWSYEIGPQDSGGGGPVCTDDSGNIYFTWNYDTTGNGSIAHQLPSIFSLNNQGEFRWKVHFGEDRGFAIFYDIIGTSDGRIIACGQEGNNLLSGGNYRTGWIVCIDTLGTKLWERRYILDETSNSGNNYYHQIESENGGLVLSGNLYKEGGGSDVYVIKTDPTGCLIKDCPLYNFTSFLTTTKIHEYDNDLFYQYVENSTLNIISKMPATKVLYYVIVNLNGQVISTGEINDTPTKINISGLQQNYYLIQIYDANGSICSVLKFINVQ